MAGWLVVSVCDYGQRFKVCIKVSSNQLIVHEVSKPNISNLSVQATNKQSFFRGQKPKYICASDLMSESQDVELQDACV